MTARKGDESTIQKSCKFDEDLSNLTFLRYSVENSSNLSTFTEQN